MNERVTVWLLKPKDRPTFLLQWIDPDSGDRRSRSARTTKRREAEQRRTDLEYEKLTHKMHQEPSTLTWGAFRELYEDEHVFGFKPTAQAKAMSVLNVFEGIVKPEKLTDVTERRLSMFLKARREAGRSVHSIKGDFAHLHAALAWAKDQKLLDTIPTFPKVKAPKKRSKGRPITGEEFERMLAKCPSRDWQDYLSGLWLSGIRLSESIDLWWDREGKQHFDFSGKRPFIVIPAETEKGGRDRRIPLTPDFAEFQALLRATARLRKSGSTKRFLLFLRMTGCRPGEASAMEWSDWDRERGIVLLERHKTAEKTGKPRVIFLPPPAEKLLRWIEARQNGNTVFVTEGGLTWNRSRTRSRMRTLRKYSGLDPEVKLYGIRHMFATEGLARGIPARIVAELLGHTSLAMLETYTHLEGKVDLMRAAADQIATEHAIKTWSIPTANQTREQNEELLTTVRQLQAAVHVLLAKQHKKPSSKPSEAAPLPFTPVDSPAFHIMDNIQQTVFKLVTREPASIDQIYREADGLPVQAVGSALNLLSWRGHVVKLPGGFFRLPEKPRAKLEGGAA